MKPIYLLSVFALTYLSISAQAPQLLNYQAVARNTQGTVLVSQPVGVRLMVHDQTSSGTVLYSETQATTTNQFGLFTLQIGNGSNQTGTFSSIDWSTGNKFLEVDIDPTGGSSYASVGTSELLSVPYALYSQTAASVSGSANYVAKFATGSTIGNSQLLDDGTNVGIGTASPTAHVHLFSAADTTNPNLEVEQNSADNAIIRLTNNVANSWWDIRATDLMFSIFSKSVDDRVLDISPYNGSVEIGYDHSGSLSGQFKVYAKTYMGAYVTNQTASSGDYGIYGSVTGTGYMYGVTGYAQGSGSGPNYGIYGNYSGGTGSYAGYFQGSVYTTGSYLPSDEKLKQNIAEIHNPLSTVLALRPASYLYKTSEYSHMNLPEGTQYGFIAQELEKVLPTAVRQTIQPAKVDHNTQKEIIPAVSFKAINYMQIIPILVGAMQEQNETINGLKSSIELLNRQNATLQQQLNKLAK